MTNPIIIIGSGLAGYTLAREFRKLDQTTPLQIFTQDDGVYYSKPQLSSALTHHKTAEALATASLEKISTQLKAEVFPYTTIDRINPEKQFIQAANKTYAYSSLILAQGAEVIKPVITGPATKEILNINNLLEYRAFRGNITNKKRIAILGSGLVGCEFANDLTNGGFEVDVIALAKTPLDILLPAELGKVFQDELSKIGIHWHLETTVLSVNYQNNQLILSLSNGTKITTDIFLSAIGLKPVLTLAKQTGIAVNKGVVVNQYLETNIKNIYALGDCAEVCGLVMYYVAPLVICAKALAATLYGNKTPASYPPMPVILKTPACPVVVNPPPNNITGQWQITGTPPDYRALFYDDAKKLRGFALTGKSVLEKMHLMQEVPNLF